MEGKTWILVLLAVAAFSLLRIFSQWRGMSRRRRTIDWDEHFIQGLRKAGLNTFEVHTVDFFFTLPTRAAAEQLAFALRPEGYQLDIRDAEGGVVSLHARRDMRLVVADMQALTARFTQLAAQHGGKYDNWAVARG
ncbi:MAG TPA: ribonuclease E inhibitor RraB [Steroidobacteraceae bacterium]|nr:ribonuclease E inhibitor RraB [Steroidobacteraceae bacterium]